MSVCEAREAWFGTLAHPPATMKTYRAVAGALLAPIDNLPVQSVTPARVVETFGAVLADKSGSTQRHSLSVVRMCWDWLHEQGHVTANPWRTAKLKLRRENRGKETLTRDAARKVFEVALTWIENPPANNAWERRTRQEGALAVALVMLLGCRPSEVLRRVVADLDDNGTVLRIPKGKTNNARREYEIPAVLLPHVKAHVEGKQATDVLFPHGYEWVTKWTYRLCAAAGVPRVCGYSWRHFAASTLHRRGVAGKIIAAELGHADERVTFRNYISDGAQTETRQRAVLKVFEGGRGRQPGPDVSEVVPSGKIEVAG
jgi:integrase